MGSLPSSFASENSEEQIGQCLTPFKNYELVFSEQEVWETSNSTPLFAFMNPQSFNTVSFVSVLVPFVCPAWRLVPIHSVLADLNEKHLNVFLNSFHTLWTMEFLVLSSMASIFKLPRSRDLIFGEQT